MLVSVIIPNYNHAPYLAQRVDSVLNQSYTNFEVIILDDCSTDSSRDIIEQYQNHPKVSKIVYNETNSGSTFKQWQKGIDLAQGEWIWMAESDDVAEFKFLEELIAKTKKYPNLSIVYSESLKIDSAGKNIGSWRSQSKTFKIYEEDFFMNGIDFIHDYLIFQNLIPNASAVIFKLDYSNKKNFDISKYTINGDWFFWTELLKKGNIYYSNDTLNKTRFHN